MHSNLIIRIGSFEFVGYARLVRIQSIGAVNVLIVDIYFKLGKNWVEFVNYISLETNWSLMLLLRFLNCFCFFSVLFFQTFGIVKFVTRTLDNIQYQSQVCQANIVVPIRFKFKFSAASIKWGSRLKIFFRGTTRLRQLLEVSLQGLQKLSQTVSTEKCSTWLMMHVCKKIFRYRLFCLADLVQMTLLTLFFPLPLLKCFLRVWFRNNFSKCTNPRPRCRPKPLHNISLLNLKWTNYLVTSS